MAIGAGYKSKAGFRIIGFAASDLAYPVALGTPLPGTIQAFDQVAFTKELLTPNSEFQLDETLDGKSGFSATNNVSRLPSGSLDVNGTYLGLNQLLSALFGFEKVRVTAALESPVYETIGGGAAALSGTITASTASSLTDSGASFPTSIVGDFVRLEKLGANADIYYQVRRITARPSSTQITIAPDWTDIPPATTPYKIARTFTHTYEFSKNMHRELGSDLITGIWNANARFVRWGVLGIDKTVSVHEWQGCYVNSMKFKLDREGVTMTFELLPFWFDLRTSGRNSSASGWAFHAESYHVRSRIRFADCEFYLGAHAASDLSAGNKIGINSLEFSIENDLQGDLQTLLSGLYRDEPARNGKRRVTGSFTVPRHTSNARLSNYTAGDLLMAELIASGPALDSVLAAKHYLFFRSLKLSKAEASVAGAEIIEEKYDFQCLIPPSASGATWPTPTAGADNSELIWRTFDHYPFNNYMGQHEDYD